LQKYKIGERIKGQKGHESDLQKISSLPHLTRPGKSQEKGTQKRNKMTSGNYQVCHVFSKTKKAGVIVIIFSLGWCDFLKKIFFIIFVL
jgi:hypothetical protein